MPLIHVPQTAHPEAHSEAVQILQNYAYESQKCPCMDAGTRSYRAREGEQRRFRRAQKTFKHNSYRILIAQRSSRVCGLRHMNPWHSPRELPNIKLSLNMRFPYLHFVPLAYNHITHGLNNSFYTQNLRKQPKQGKRVNFIINIYPKTIILTSIFIKKCPCFCAYFCLYYHVVKRR